MNIINIIDIVFIVNIILVRKHFRGCLPYCDRYTPKALIFCIQNLCTKEELVIIKLLSNEENFFLEEDIFLGGLLIKKKIQSFALNMTN